MKLFISVLALCMAQAAYASDLFSNLQPRPFKLADALEADATIGGYPIWKGDGKWRLFDIVRRESTGNAANVALGDIKVFQTSEKRLVAVMIISANLSQNDIRWLGEPCKRDDMLYKANIGRSTWEDNCVTLNHITNHANNPVGKDAELYALFKEQGVDIPSTVLQFQFTRNGSNGRFYHVRLSVNPEAYGFSKESEPSWGRNPWNKTMSFNEPVKKQFIDALGAWGLGFAKQMDAALDQKQDAFTSIPPLSSVLTLKPTVAEPKSKLTLD
jgi:hypothetical protein